MKPTSAETSHLVAITQRLTRERARLASASTDGEKALREVWVRQAEKELADEIAFLKSKGVVLEEAKTDKELLAELGL